MVSSDLKVIGVLTVLLLASCGGDKNLSLSVPGNNPDRAFAVEIRGGDGLLHGPLARGANGDFLLENELFRVIIQKPGRNWFGIGTYGGNIIDAARKDVGGNFLPDHLEEFVLGVNIENTPNYTEVWIANDGSDGEPAQVCARGPDDLLDFVNASSTIQDLGLTFPSSADDRDLPLEIETCYSLRQGEPWVTLDTTLVNLSSEDLDIWLVEYLNGSGEVEAFQPQIGFGEPLFTSACPMESAVACESGLCDQCNYLAYSGHDGAAGVSYGYIHEVPGSASISTSGVNVIMLGKTVIEIVFGPPEGNFHVPADGELELRRYFAVGDGTASSIADIRNELASIETGSLNGAVTSAGEAISGASIAVFQTLNGAIDPPTLFMAGHARSDSNGEYSMTLPPGEYEMQVNAEGYPFADSEPRAVSIAVDQAVTADFDLPGSGYLQVAVTARPLEGPSEAIPAKVQVVGFDPSPLLRNGLAGTGVFADDSDNLPYGITLVEFVDRTGMTERLPLEPGDYQVVVSRGPRYSAFTQDITVVSGETVQVQAELGQVIDTKDTIYADFHVHSIDSPDAEVSRDERVATYLAEGVDFFTPSEHGMRVDYLQTLVGMDVVDLIATTPGGEITPFDYGHFNSWPVTVDDSLISGGSVDWGRAAEPGFDFPEYGSYVLSPGEIFSESLSDPRQNIIQVNHMASHFGGGGLGIDTGQVPPQSSVNPALRRLDPDLSNAFDDGFQALEVWIGTNGRAGIFAEFLGQNIGDWFNLINQGLVRTGVADSDSHDRRTTFLATRNQLASAVTNPGQLGGQAEALAASVVEGRVVGTNGPYVSILARGSFAGAAGEAGLGVGQSRTLAIDADSAVEVVLDIQSAAWAQVDSVDFYINNQPERTSGPPQVARYGVCADVTVSRGDPGWSESLVEVSSGIQGASRQEVQVSLALPAVQGDSWLVAIVHGTDGVSLPMFPVVPEDIAEDGNATLEDLTDGNLGEEGVLAYAFTNPLFLDVGDDGWTPPGVNNAACSP